mmetsp:Transcript_165/g.408  ORF Transcript_165/g.408 Transcript_165/m.408 type:complete len:199 (-) Transcript_165:59-655(-)
MKQTVLCCLILMDLFRSLGAFTVPFKVSSWKNVKLAMNLDDNHDTICTRRSFLSGGALMLGVSATAVGKANAENPEDDIPWTPFNGLIFNYRNSQYPGLDASTLDEPSVPFLEFGKRLEKGEVAFVEFMYPHGDAAYVTFKPSEEEPDPKPIRIGEGFPLEQHDGWSSPAFVVRALNNYGVPHKFTVPALEKFRVSSS